MSAHANPHSEEVPSFDELFSRNPATRNRGALAYINYQLLHSWRGAAWRNCRPRRQAQIVECYKRLIPDALRGIDFGTEHEDSAKDLLDELILEMSEIEDELDLAEREGGRPGNITLPTETYGIPIRSRVPRREPIHVTLLRWLHRVGLINSLAWVQAAFDLSSASTPGLSNEARWNEVLQWAGTILVFARLGTVMPSGTSVAGLVRWAQTVMSAERRRLAGQPMSSSAPIDQASELGTDASSPSNDSIGLTGDSDPGSNPAPPSNEPVE